MFIKYFGEEKRRLEPVLNNRPIYSIMPMQGARCPVCVRAVTPTLNH